MKKIVYCADGTWCHPDTTADVSDKDSNVYKLFKMLPPSATQTAFYDDGIGAAGSFFHRLFQGAFGEGLFTKIKQGYTQIAHSYNEGDQIFLFGFSRGAYTARSIAGMIACAGLPARTDFPQGAIDDAFAAYRKPPGSPDRTAAVQALSAKYGNRPVDIEMIGVWDTVGALGIPSLYGGVDPVRYGFLNVSLSSHVHAAYQALAIDESRAEFPPTLWDSEPAPGQILEQVWFAGCHGNVGGGCPDSTLAEIPLKWMVDKCILHGLAIDPLARARYTACAADWALAPLDVPWPGYKILAPPRARTVAADAAIANSVPARLAGVAAYAPTNLTLGADRTLAGTYRMTAI